MYIVLALSRIYSARRQAITRDDDDEVTGGTTEDPLQDLEQRVERDCEGLRKNSPRRGGGGGGGGGLRRLVKKKP